MTEDARPAYRYLEPLPEPTYGRAERRARWVLMLAAVTAVLIFLAGSLVAIGSGP